jgi:hypothetical protein
MGTLTIVTVMLLAASSLTLPDVGTDGDNKTGTQLTAPQRRQYEQCLSAIQRLETEVHVLSATPSRPEPAINIYAKHRSTIRLAAISVRKCHATFSSSLTLEQRTAMKELPRQLNHTWSEIHRHLLLLDDDLNQHLLDNGRLILHAQELERLVDEYLERYRKFGTDTAVGRQPFAPRPKPAQVRLRSQQGQP